MDGQVDWQKYERIDRSLSLDFLSMVAAPLATSGVVSDRSLAEFRAQLADLHLRNSEHSLLTDLEAAGNDLSCLILMRYGETELPINLLRFGQHRRLKEIVTTLAGCVDMLLAKSNLFFNRTIPVGNARGTARQTLVSSFLIDLASNLEEATGAFLAAHEGTQAFAGTSFMGRRPEDESQDLEIARSLGFKRVEYRCLPQLVDRMIRDQIVLGAQAFLDAIVAFADQFGKATNQDTGKIHLVAESIEAELRGLGAMSFPDSDDVTNWEHKRRSYSMSLFRLERLISVSVERFGDLFNKYRGESRGQVISGACIRRTAYQLVEEGIQPRKAVEASRAMADYLVARAIKPSELLESELVKIHPNLSKQALTLLQELTSENPGSQATLMDKRSTHSRMDALKQSFVKATQIFCALILFVGCGYKTPPKSDIADLRPSIPFKKLDAVPADPDKDLRQKKEAQ